MLWTSFSLDRVEVLNLTTGMLLKSQTFERSIILSQAISGQATQMQCLMTIHLIDKYTLPLLCTQVLLCILHTSDLFALGILLPQKETGERLDKLHYFNIVRSVPPPEIHTIWGSLHFLPLVLNVFLSHYDSGTFLYHLAVGEYGFDIVGSPCMTFTRYM